MSWLELSVPASAESVDAVSQALEGLGAVAVTVRPDQGVDILEPAPGEQPMAGSNVVTGLFAADADARALMAGLATAIGTGDAGAARVQVLHEEHWVQAWRQKAVAREFGEGLWVVPDDAPHPEGARAVVRLDPGLAFGTGAHATTSLCLAWLASLDLRGRTVLDFGCGSGILAIAAAQLGAREVHALDHDPQAVMAAGENARRNAVSDRVHVGDDPPPCDVVVANILANALTSLAPRLTGLVRPHGWIGLSGILPGQAAQVSACYVPSFVMSSPREEDGWVLLVGRRT